MYVPVLQSMQQQPKQQTDSNSINNELANSISSYNDLHRAIPSTYSLQTPKPDSTFAKIQHLNYIKKRHPLRQLFTTSFWKLCSEHYQYELIRSFFTIFQCEALKIWLHWNKQRKIILDISHVNFNRLILINLSANLIDNVEALTWLDCPLLEEMFLWNNRITRIQSLHKLQLKKLKIIDFHINHISHIQKLPRSSLPSISFINLQNNNLSQVSAVTRFTINLSLSNSNPQNQIKIKLLNNPLIKAMGYPLKKGKKGKKQLEFITIKNRCQYYKATYV